MYRHSQLANYGDPRRWDDPHYLSCYDVWQDDGMTEWGYAEPQCDEEEEPFYLEAGKWYWMYSMPGYLDRGDPQGPFDTWGEAAADMADDVWPWDDFSAAAERYYSMLVIGWREGR
ncbi:MAG: hypothetical protein IPH08_04140 [Rhodocyclaceae bacterium]|nr:hypothetical protein [Rhodocyclaceae bacterium]